MPTDGEEPNSPDHIQPDPLLKQGAFIDPSTNGCPQSEITTDPDVSLQDPPDYGEPLGSAGPSTPIHNPDYSDAGTPPCATPLREHWGGSEPASDPSPAEVTDWLPLGWRVEFRVRSSGASAGTKDKYYVDPVSNSRFRSKKEVLFFLETGQKKKKRAVNSDGDTPSANNSHSQKRKKSASKATVSVKNFNFDDVPAKVKWSLTDVYEGLWRPLLGGVERVAETAKQEWAATFTYLTLQNGGRATL
ncbi:hypothetical protein Nepgr_000104 [Nepenthes gracilis]|uniref:MBD domain-containing protein n=1 Tax=Nepenthes gracilis TaxID=150966 RepID=A0AAD3RWD1_NEPGR|nr:hypothetical protein Nepgr_000104 [Nepenthes gracilis]